MCEGRGRSSLRLPVVLWHDSHQPVRGRVELNEIQVADLIVGTQNRCLDTTTATVATQMSGSLGRGGSRVGC